MNRYTSILFFVFIVIILPSQVTSASIALNTCNCDHVIALNTWKTDAQQADIGPGDVVCIEAGTRTSPIRLENFNGTANKPILIKNCGGKVVIDLPSSNGYGLAVANSSHFRLTGTGDPNIEYGIQVDGPNLGVTVGGLSRENIEVDHIEAKNVGFASFMVKTDPTCNSATWRANFPKMTDVRVHDNYANYTDDGEGFYIGYTFSNGREITCGGQQITVYAHIIEGLQVYNNRTRDTGAEGIQVSSSPGAIIRDNVIDTAGFHPFAQYQSNGMQIGGTGVVVYNNRLQDIKANGIIAFGTGHKIYNNLIVRTGSNGTFADDRAQGDGIVFVNNTIVSPTEHGLSLYVDEAGPSIVKNNLIVNPGEQYFRKLNNNVVVEESNNVFLSTVGTAHFVNAAADDYALTSNSPAVDAGTNVSGLGIITDFSNIPRPQGNAYDVGAYEYAQYVYDVNGDGIISPADAIFVINRINQSPLTDTVADIDLDDDIDSDDVQLILPMLGQLAD